MNYLLQALADHEGYLQTECGLSIAELAAWLELPHQVIEQWAAEARGSRLVKRTYLGGYRLTERGKRRVKTRR